MKIVQYGAGNIGRSLVGQLFSAAGWEVVFVDVVPEVVDAFNRRGEYTVVVKERIPGEIRVSGVRAVDGRDSQAVASEIADCDLLSTAVGAGVLPRIAPTLARGLLERDRPLDILLCENLRGAPRLVRGFLENDLPEDFGFDDRVGLIATSIGKMVPIMPSEVRERDPLEVWAEAYNQIVADRRGFVGPIPEVEGLVVRDCFEAYVDQKLFVHNLGHAASAYLGDRRGAVTIAEAMKDPQTSSIVKEAMRESGKALVHLYPEELTERAMTEYIEDLHRRFQNPALGDTVFRVGRDRLRKYAPEDRLIGSLRACQKAGVDPQNLFEGIAAGLRFGATDESGNRHESDIEFDRIYEETGLSGLLEKVCGIDGKSDRDSEIVERIKDTSSRKFPLPPGEG